MELGGGGGIDADLGRLRLGRGRGLLGDGGRGWSGRVPSRAAGLINAESPTDVAGVLGVGIGTPVVLGRGFGDRGAIVPGGGDGTVRAGAVGRLDVGGPCRRSSGRLRGRALGGAAGVVDSATGVVGGKRLGVGSGCGDRLTGGAVQHGTVDAGARAVGATANAGGRCFGRALAAGVRPDTVDILLPAAGGRARRGEGAGLWSRSARTCVGGAAVGALRPAVAGIVGDAGAVAGGVRGLGPGGGSPGSARSLRSTRAT